MQQATGAAARPRAADVAFALMLAAAASVLIQAVAVPLQIGPTVAGAKEEAAAQHLSVAALQHELVVVSIVLVAAGVVVAGLIALCAFRLRSGHRAARVGAIALALVLIASLDVPLILTALVLAAAIVMTFLRPVAAWLKAVAPDRALRRRRR